MISLQGSSKRNPWSREFSVEEKDTVVSDSKGETAYPFSLRSLMLPVMRNQSLPGIAMVTFLHLLCCSVWLTPSLALVLSSSSPATNRIDPLSHQNVSSTSGNQTALGEPFGDLITSRLAELERLYSPDALRLYRVRAVFPVGESTDASKFTFISIKAWLPARGLFVETFNMQDNPYTWGPATESPPSRSRGRPRRSLWSWTERRPLTLANAFKKLQEYGVLRPFLRVSIVKFEQMITWAPNDQPYWMFETDGERPIVMGAHDQIVYDQTQADLQELNLDDDEASGSVATS